MLYLLALLLDVHIAVIEGRHQRGIQLPDTPQANKDSQPPGLQINTAPFCFEKARVFKGRTWLSCSSLPSRNAL